jgi:hypothetical protein
VPASPPPAPAAGKEKEAALPAAAKQEPKAAPKAVRERTERKPRGAGAAAGAAGGARQSTGQSKGQSTGQSTGQTTRGPKKAAAKTPTRIDLAALGLPTAPESVVEHIVGYKGVGQRSADQLVEAFGADRVFNALQTEPERVKEVLGARRGDALLEAWADDVAFRRANTVAAQRPAAGKGEPQPEGDGASSRRSRGRRGGRRGRRPGSGAAEE